MSKLGVVKREKSIDEIFGLDKNIVEIETEKLVEFEEHPFKVKDDEDFQNLVESVRINGIIEPLIIREKGKKYELLSGHRRTHAAIVNELETVPAIINNVDDDTATLIVVNTNLERRQSILPSERAKAYLLRNRVYSSQGKRNDLTNEERGRWTDLVKDELGYSHSQIARYIRLNYLIDELLDMLDNSTLAFSPAVELSFLKKEHQEAVCAIIKAENITITTNQAKDLKEKGDMLEVDYIKELLMGKVLAQRKKIIIPFKRIREYFSDSQSDDEIIDTILELLKNHNAPSTNLVRS